MRQKDVCLSCKIAFNRGTNIETPVKKVCPNCSEPLVQVNHKFKPPKKTDTKKWEVVNYLISNGFNFNHAYEMIEPGVYKQIGKFPENMRDAKEFVKLHKK